MRALSVTSAATEAPTRLVRLCFALLLLVLTIVAFRDEYGRVPLLGHVDLAIHEFGHMLFQPFGIAFLGETMTILGGSLLQVVFPLIFAVYFARPREGYRPDRLAVASCVWWCGLNLLDVSVYMADSRAGQLMLLTGETGSEGGPHDWRMLLSSWGVLRHDLVYAERVRIVALFIAAASVLAALWFEWFRKAEPPSEPATDEALLV
jgi:hypothetical protein